MKAQRIALFGGTFDPVHLGHIEVAQAAVDALDLDLVLFVPCRQSPHKDDGTVASEDDRLEMLEIATADIPWAAISEIEMLLPPPSYSWLTAESMREIFPSARLFWLMGEDQWEVIDSWARPEYFATLVEIIVHSRGGTPGPNPAFRTHFISGRHPASATAIREAAPANLPGEWLDPAVERFIRDRGLYGSGS
ncbi:MAG: nicotinate (nicotinamide) nucleotide adenylyltransferase [Akkermansiaceae bacterium]|nr:nicotinate (nicotinamide) nucleotide adenylyltransferase [Akkermansiaceae bacterium]